MGKYIRYEFVNQQGLRIVNDHMSQHGEAATLRYVPGTTIRGLIISKMAAKGKLDAWKKQLFSDDIQFLNAYVCADKKEMIPSPKGFYEDKTTTEGQKEIQNVVLDGAFDDGMKRAGLGEYCYFEDGVIRYVSVATSSDLKIKINDVKRDVFRNEYISPGHVFVGYIRVVDEQIRNEIKGIIEEGFFLGNARSSGLGRCKCIGLSETDALPYEEYAANAEGECYLFLVSDGCMRNEEGEYCGIDEKKLAERMGVEELEILFASTSRRISGAYNRNWGGRTPSLPLFEKGSVFHLRFNGKASAERMRKIMDEGIGIGGNEGFGRVLFLKDYSKLHAKLAASPRREVSERKNISCADEESIRVVAKNMLINRIKEACEEYLLKEGGRLRDTASSQMGIVDSICTQYRYQPKRADQALEQFFTHRDDKEKSQKIQKQYRSNRIMKEFLYDKVWKGDLLTLVGYSRDSVMGIPIRELLTENELTQKKLELISDLIRYQNKKEA